MVHRKSLVLLTGVGVLGLITAGCEEKTAPAPKTNPPPPAATGSTGSTAPTTPPSTPK